MDLVDYDELTLHAAGPCLLRYTQPAISRHCCPSTLELHHASLAVLAASFPALTFKSYLLFIAWSGPFIRLQRVYANALACPSFRLSRAGIVSKRPKL